MPSRPRSRARLMLSSEAPGRVLRYRVNACYVMRKTQVPVSVLCAHWFIIACL